MAEDHAEEERLAVIARYDKGRDEGADINDWEDPALEIYHVTDRYGFIHDRVLPKLRADEVKRIAIENERVDKWLNMTKKWAKFKNSEKLRQRVYKGIPDKMRIRAWRLILDLDVIKKQQVGKYHDMCQLARKYSPDVRQIDLDVNRTYRDTRMFRERYGKEQKALFNVLCAYSIYNAEVGYCQGMSQVAALLLMYMEEEDAFWALSQLMTNTKFGMHGFFINGFPKLVRFQAHHDKVLKIMVPRLKKHFDKHGVDSGLYTLKWFFQCFLDRVPFELSLRLWDIFLYEGDRVLVCAAYAILKMHYKQLLAKKNMDDILSYLQCELPVNFGIDLDKAIIYYEQYADDLRAKKLDTGGEPTEEELPKKPFGVIEIKPVPIKRENPVEKVKESAETKEVRLSSTSYGTQDDEEDGELSIDDKGSVGHRSLTAASVASSSFGDSPKKTTTVTVEEPHNEIPSISPVALSTTTRISPSIATPESSNERVANGPSDQFPAMSQIKMNGLAHNSPVRKHSPSPPPPPPRSPQPNVLQSVPSVTPPTKRLNNLEERGPSIIPISPQQNNPKVHHSNFLQSSSVSVQQHQQSAHYSQVNKRVPPPVMPRKPLADSTGRNMYENKDSSTNNIDGSGVSGENIPISITSDAVRIHVPYSSNYNNNNNTSSSVILSTPPPSSSLQSTSLTAHSSSSSSSPVNNQRNNFDIKKSDPNRIKIDVSSSHST